MSAVIKALEKILANSPARQLVKIYQQLPARLKKEIHPKDFGEMLEHELLMAGNTRIAVVLDQQLVVVREELFNSCSFRVQLTQEEYQDQRLIIGHRFIPFIHPAIPVEKLVFLDDQEQALTIKFAPMPINPETGIYFSLLPPYGIAQYLREDVAEDRISLATLDLQPIFAQRSFRKDDQLLITARDYSAHEFQVEVMDSREISSRRLADRYYDQQLTKAIYEVLDVIGQAFLPIDMHLFWSMARLGPQAIQKPGTPFGPFISQHDTLAFFHEGPYSFLQDKDYLDEMMEKALEQSMHPSLEEMGTATDFDGIMQELGNSFSEVLTRALLTQKLIEHRRIDQEEILQLIFAAHPTPFFNNRQHGNFDRAFKKMVQQVERQWSDRQLPLPYLQLLRKAISFKLDIVQLLRDLNEYIHDPHQLNMEALLQLQPIDHSLDQILENILSETPMAHQEAQALTKQLNNGREKFSHFRDDFLSNL